MEKRNWTRKELEAFIATASAIEKRTRYGIRSERCSQRCTVLAWSNGAAR